MLYWKDGGQSPPSGRMVSKNVYVWSILVILSVLMVACFGENNSSTPSHCKDEACPHPSSTPIPSPTPSAVALDVAPPSTPLVCPGQQNSGSNDFVSENGSTFVYHGSPMRFYGYASYPASIGGASAWHKPDFTQYIDHIMQMGARLGQNLFRPTDYWSKKDPHPEQGSESIWKNLDYLVCAAQNYGTFVLMDLSAFQKVLISRHLDDFDPNNWKSFLTATARHYSHQ